MAYDPADGLTATYKALFEYVDETLALREGLFARLLASQLAPKWQVRWGLDLPLRGFRRLLALARWIGVVRSYRSFSDEARAEILAIATNAEKEATGFRHVVSAYWLESLAKECCVTFHLDAGRVAALRKIHEVYETPSPFQRFTSPQLFFTVAGVVLAALAVLVPKEAFEVLNWGSAVYGWFRVGVAAALGVVVLVLVYLAGLHRISARSRRAAEAFPHVLTYCEIESAFASDGEQISAPSVKSPGALPQNMA
jgi:hypothetical protein